MNRLNRNDVKHEDRLNRFPLMQRAACGGEVDLVQFQILVQPVGWTNLGKLHWRPPEHFRPISLRPVREPCASNHFDAIMNCEAG
jgi:hypothetical protein